MRRYAANTEVTVEKTRNEIERLLTGYGAHSFAFAIKPSMAMVQFELGKRLVRFVLPLKLAAEIRSVQKWEQDCRTRWRALLLSIKAKLETVRSGIATFDEEFAALQAEAVEAKQAEMTRWAEWGAYVVKDGGVVTAFLRRCPQQKPSLRPLVSPPKARPCHHRIE